MKWNSLHSMTAGALALIVVSVGTTAFFFTHPFTPTFKTMTVVPRNLQETVEMSGSIVSAKNVDLSFDRSGRVTVVPVAVGQSVQAGQALVILENTMESGQLAQAQAALQVRLAGLSASDLAVYQASVDAALADLNKTKADTITSADFAYQNAETILRSVSVKIDDALTAADNILGIDNTIANDDIEKYLSISDQTKLSAAQTAYQSAKGSRENVRAALANIKSSNDHTAIDEAIAPSTQALTDASLLLSRVSEVLIATPTVGTLTQSSLDAKKTIVSTTRSGVNTQASAVVSAQQGISNAKNSQGDIGGASQGLIAIKQAAYDQALANLHAKQSPPRDVDTAPLRAAVEIARGALDKTFLRAPVSGVVARQDAKAGAIVSPGMALVSVVNPSALQIEGKLSELDVVKVHVGDVVSVTTDAYGTGTVFPATVVAVDQSASASGYKVVVQLNGSDDRLKAGMQSTATIQTKGKSSVLAVPTSSLTKKNGKSFVQIIGSNNVRSEKEVQTGIVSFDGYAEVLNGLNAQDTVVTFGN